MDDPDQCIKMKIVYHEKMVTCRAERISLENGSEHPPEYSQLNPTRAKLQNKKSEPGRTKSIKTFDTIPAQPPSNHTSTWLSLSRWPNCEKLGSSWARI